MKTGLVVQYSKGKKIPDNKTKLIRDVDIVLGRASGEKQDTATAFDKNGRLIECLLQARVETIGSHGLIIVGLQNHLTSGQIQYSYQEWWCPTVLTEGE